MSRRRAALAALALAALALPGQASAHAYLITTYPRASGVLSAPPAEVKLTFDEAVEPRFAIVSVTDKGGRSQTTFAAQRSPGDPDTLEVGLRPHLSQGWYLVYWRVISVDGHPVQGAFTFAVGPRPGPAPRFAVPHISQTATTTPVLIGRWAMFLAVLSAIGLFTMRIAIVRPLARRLPGTSLRSLSVAQLVAAGLALVAIPVYLEEATAIDSLHSFFAVGTLVPLFGVTAFGRGYIDLELCFGLFAAAAAVALFVDRPERETRSVAELLAGLGAAAAAAAALIIPGTAGHAAQTAPRWLALSLDWMHLASGSVWLGGLIGLLVLWIRLPADRRSPALALAVPRFSSVALVAVALLLGSGVGATVLHLPLLAALWQTAYGQTILVKAGLLAAAMVLGAINLVRTTPRLVAAARLPREARPALALLRRVVSGEVALLVTAVGAAALLSSLAPPPPALAEEGVGDGPRRPRPGRRHPRAGGLYPQGARRSQQGGGSQHVRGQDHARRGARSGRPGDADVCDARHADGERGIRPDRDGPGLYERPAPALVMVGHWGLTFEVAPPGGQPFSALVVDFANG